ncbi:MAG: HIT domain-containing protein [Candidatus Aenigmarchaeota archaeon]|nr:HIT domain-containing protein [Candidatus Aenigmarchaeota archaeon]
MADQPRPCIFCAIAEGKIPAKKVYENSDTVAFLDINPRSRGMSVVIPKKHYANMNDEPLTSSNVFQVSQNVVKMIKDSLSPDTVYLSVMPSQEVPHFHVKLYPVYGDERPLSESQAVKASDQDLEAISNSIKSATVNLFSAPKGEEKSREPEISEEDARYLRTRAEIA